MPRLVDLNTFDGFLGIAFMAPHQAATKVSGAKQSVAFSRLTISSGAAHLLPIGLNRLGRIGVNDEAHIRLVDSHAKSDRGAHHKAIFEQEPALTFSTVFRFKPSMIGERRDAMPLQRFGELLCALSRCRIDDPAFAFMGADEVDQTIRFVP